MIFSGLIVAVNYPCGVRGFERARHLNCHVEYLIKCQARVADIIAQRAALNKFRGDVIAPVLLPKVVDGDNVGMVQRGGGTGFALETTHALRIVQQLRRQVFQRRLPPKPLVLSQINCTHPAVPQLSHQPVGANHFAAEILRIIGTRH